MPTQITIIKKHYALTDLITDFYKFGPKLRSILGLSIFIYGMISDLRTDSLRDAFSLI